MHSSSGSPLRLLMRAACLTVAAGAATAALALPAAATGDSAAPEGKPCELRTFLTILPTLWLAEGTTLTINGQTYKCVNGQFQNA